MHYTTPEELAALTSAVYGHCPSVVVITRLVQISALVSTSHRSLPGGFPLFVRLFVRCVLMAFKAFGHVAVGKVSSARRLSFVLTHFLWPKAYMHNSKR